jgi:hypothetical protein
MIVSTERVETEGNHVNTSAAEIESSIFIQLKTHPHSMAWIKLDENGLDKIRQNHGKLMSDAQCPALLEDRGQL